jgi:hypothetical protein
MMQTSAFLAHFAARFLGSLLKKSTTHQPTLLAVPASVTTLAHGSSDAAEHKAESIKTATASRPVRVLHLPETTGAGRIRICGRMADVCAELDRMAALEVA